MTDEHQLQDPDAWDFENAEVKAPAKGARAVVSVALGRDLFERVTEAAEASGMKTSEFIRATLVDALERGNAPVVPLWAEAQTKIGYSIVIEGEENTATADASLQPV